MILICLASDLQILFILSMDLTFLFDQFCGLFFLLLLLFFIKCQHPITMLQSLLLFFYLLIWGMAVSCLYEVMSYI